MGAIELPDGQFRQPSLLTRAPAKRILTHLFVMPASADARFAVHPTVAVRLSNRLFLLALLVLGLRLGGAVI